MHKKTQTFEQAITRLEEITANIQNNDTPLEDALKQYEEGRKLVLFCRQKLGEVEQKLSVLDNDELLRLDLDKSLPSTKKTMSNKKTPPQSDELFSPPTTDDHLPF
ncbi:MAG: exodeoxyribonuclease VII small subunit [Neisseriaceae bacterium]|nr:exodeoxyribonuclease VII small subunit [Neisseriaceae bacterium]MBR3425271.1 exodeoxyribonuclease VII small subunit [Neisseriaceae bacterium]